MKKTLILVAGLSLMIAGCGDKDEPATLQTEKVVTEPAAKPAVPASKAMDGMQGSMMESAPEPMGEAAGDMHDSMMESSPKAMMGSGSEATEEAGEAAEDMQEMAPGGSGDSKMEMMEEGMKGSAEMPAE